MSCSSLIARGALLGALATLAGCGGSKGDTMLMRESFNSDDTYSRSVASTSPQACEAARRVLLSQGYAVTRADAAAVEGSKNFHQGSRPERTTQSAHFLRHAGRRQGAGVRQRIAGPLRAEKEFDLGQRRCRCAWFVVVAGRQQRRLAGARVQHHGAGRGLLQTLLRPSEFVSAQGDRSGACTCTCCSVTATACDVIGSGACGHSGQRGSHSTGHAHYSCAATCCNAGRTATSGAIAGRGAGPAADTSPGAANRASNPAVMERFRLCSKA